MLTYQDFENAQNQQDFLLQAITDHKGGELYRTAVDADLYDRQRNKTINEYVKTLFLLTGERVQDFTATNAKIASNFFNRLNTQRRTYSLGNGVSFTDHVRKAVAADGTEYSVDETKERLGDDFDSALYKLGYYALIHGVAYGFWNVDKLHVFEVTEFVPLLDENTGVLRAGIRFWQLEDKAGEPRPMTIELYEEDGVTVYRTKNGSKESLQIVKPKRAYMIKTAQAPADPEPTVVGEENYSGLPIIPMYGSRLHQSTLVGMRQGIDSFDLIRSGFANDLSDCSQIYWLIENCGGMTDEELAQVRDRMKLNHMVVADTSQGGKITPYTQEVPYQARKEYLDSIRAGIYEDFGGLDVHTIAAGATNDHIDAAYQPLDENADDFEYQIIDFVRQLLRLIGIEDKPKFSRNRISNQKEQVEMLMLEAPYLDDETILSKLPNISIDEVAGILARRDAQSGSRLMREPPEPLDDEEEDIE